MKRNVIFLNLVATSVFAAAAVAQVSPAQSGVSVTARDSADKSTTRSAVTLSTLDRTAVPLITETKETKVDANTTRQESVTQVRQNDGTYAPMQRTTSIERKVSDAVTQTSTEILETDRQGRTRASQQVNETVTKTPTGQESRAEVYQRDASGQLVLQSQSTATETKNPDGTVSKTRVENVADVNGKLVPKEQVEEVVTKPGTNQEAITRNIKSVDHLTGRLAVTAKETETVRRDGNTTRTETVVQKSTRSGWTVTDRITTTETRAPDGSTQRETVEVGRSLYSKSTGDDFESLVPKRKIVEREMKKPDGTTTLQRDVFHRDINNEWKPASFSSAVPGTPVSKGGEY